MGISASSLLDEAKSNYVKGQAEVELKDFSPYYRKQFYIARFSQVEDDLQQHKGKTTQLLKQREAPEEAEVLYEEGLFYFDETRKWRERYVVVRANYCLECHDSLESFLKGVPPRQKLLPTGGTVLTAEEKYMTMVDRCFPEDSSVKEDFAPPLSGMPGQFPVYLRLPYRRDSYFCFRQEVKRDGFMSILSDCIRHQNQDFLKMKTCEVQAFLKAIQLYRQDRGKYDAWDMLIGSDVRVMGNLMMEQLLPSLEKDLLPRLKAKKMEKKRVWFATVEAAYILAQEHQLDGLSALKEECRVTARQQEILMHSDMDQIVECRRQLEEKVRDRVCEAAEKLCSESVQPHLCSVLEQLMAPISSGFQEGRQLSEAAMDEVCQDAQQGDNERVKEVLAKMAKPNLQSCYQKIGSLRDNLQNLQDRFGFSNITAVIHSTQIDLQQLMENAAFTFELLLYKAVTDNPDNAGSAVEKAKHRVLKQYDYDSSTVRKRISREALVSITLPFIKKNLAHTYEKEIQSLEQFIDADYVNFIHVENVYEKILLQTLDKEVTKVVKEAASLRKYDLFADRELLSQSSCSSLISPNTSMPISPLTAVNSLPEPQQNENYVSITVTPEVETPKAAGIQSSSEAANLSKKQEVEAAPLITVQQEMLVLIEEAPVTQTKAEVPATPVQAPTTQVPMTQTKADIPATQVQQEMLVLIEEAPVTQTEAEIPAAQVQAPVIQTKAEVPVNQTKAEVPATQVPLNQTKAEVPVTQVPMTQTIAEVPETLVPMTQTKAEVPATPVQAPGTQVPMTQTKAEVTSTQDHVPATQVPMIQTKAEVPGTQVPMTQTKAEVTSTQVHVAATQVPMTQTKTAVPATQVPMTQTKAEVPATPVQAPGTQVPMTQTKAEVTSTQVHVPATQVPVIQTKAEVPATPVQAPGTQVPMTQTKTAVPANQVPMTQTKAEVPATPVQAPGTQVPMTQTKAEVTSTQVHVAATQVPMTQTKAEVTSTQVHVAATQAPMTQTKDEVPATQVEVPPSEMEPPKEEVESVKTDSTVLSHNSVNEPGNTSSKGTDSQAAARSEEETKCENAAVKIEAPSNVETRDVTPAAAVTVSEPRSLDTSTGSEIESEDTVHVSQSSEDKGPATSDILEDNANLNASPVSSNDITEEKTARDEMIETVNTEVDTSVEVSAKATEPSTSGPPELTGEEPHSDAKAQPPDSIKEIRDLVVEVIEVEELVQRYPSGVPTEE